MNSFEEYTEPWSRVSLEYYYEQSLTIEYSLTQIPHYSIIEYDNEIVNIDFLKAISLMLAMKKSLKNILFPIKKYLKCIMKRGSQPLQEFFLLYIFSSNSF